MVSKKELEMILSKVPDIPNPDFRKEQYKTPPWIASEVLHLARMLGDLEGKVVADFGCGTGTFAIGASLMGSDYSIGLDLDLSSLRLAKKFSEDLGIENVDFVAIDVRKAEGEFDTIIMNPPFGTKRRGADLEFVEAAMRNSRVIYSLHNYYTKEFLERRASLKGWKITHEIPFEFPIKMIYPFHKRDLVKVKVIMLRYESGGE